MENTAAEPKSFRGQVWEVIEPESTHVAALAAQVNPLLARILASRGKASEEIPTYLKTLIRETLPEPFTVREMDVGAKRIAKAIQAGERIGIWSDYDVDGACSAALFGQILEACGHRDYVLRIPDRITEGYGPNAPGLLAMKDEKKCGLICCLDAGVMAFDALEAAAAADIEVVVVDHHEPRQDGSLPPAVAMINANRHDDDSGLGHLCAAGMVFVFFVAVVRELIRAGHFDGREGRPADRPDLMQFLDLVALATICDVMVLKGLNRAFVRAGVPILTDRSNLGIASLAIAAGINPDEPIDEKACGWILGPRINAGGRIGAPDAGALLLLEKDPVRAMSRAEALHAINVDRKEMSDSATEQAKLKLAERDLRSDRTLVFSALEDAHEGIVGISAGKLKEHFSAPAIVVTRDHNGNYKGSARSVADVNIGHIIQDAAAAGIILGGGGHGMAGGLSLREDQIEGFISFANAEIAKSDFFRTGLKPCADLAVTLADLSVETILSLEQMRPFGNGNAKPLFLLKGVKLDEFRVLKGKHHKLVLKSGRARIDALIWGTAGTPIGDDIEASVGCVLDVLGEAEINEFRGQKAPQFMISDIRLSADQELQQADANEAYGLAAQADSFARLGDLTVESVEIRQASRQKILVQDLILESVQDLKGKHLRLAFSDAGAVLSGIKWNARQETIESLTRAKGMRVNVLGELQINEWKGRKSIQIVVSDFELRNESLFQACG